jgi:hypothetical protein
MSGEVYPNWARTLVLQGWEWGLVHDPFRGTWTLLVGVAVHSTIERRGPLPDEFRDHNEVVAVAAS